MIATIKADVSFMRQTVESHTENCVKCAFAAWHVNCGSARCNHGMNGYYARNRIWFDKPNSMSWDTGKEA